jgi:CheY-like chemotaxis protein
LTSQNGNSNGKRRILAVDDDPDITFIVKAGLEASGLFEVHTFNDPEVALSSFKPGLYDLALVDFRMPRMYPEIADHIRQAIDEVYYGVKEPDEALDDAAAKSALILGW